MNIRVNKKTEHEIIKNIKAQSYIIFHLFGPFYLGSTYPKNFWKWTLINYNKIAEEYAREISDFTY